MTKYKNIDKVLLFLHFLSFFINNQKNAYLVRSWPKNK